MWLEMPLMAVAYAMGGVDTGTFISAEIAIVVFSLHMGALAIAVSACSYTTVAALVRHYELAFIYMVNLCDSRANGATGWRILEHHSWLGHGGLVDAF
jgi:hypothetical protein